MDENGRRYVDVMSCMADPSHQASFPLSEVRAALSTDDLGIEIPSQRPVWLRCDVEHDDLAFSYSLDGGDWCKVPVDLDYSLISDEAGKGEGANFTGAFVGMCCQDVSGKDMTADFEYFNYVETSAD